MTTEKKKNNHRFEVNVKIYKKRVKFVPNVHSVLAISALFLASVLIYTEMLSHSEARPLLIGEVAHFAGWAYLELPETFILETVE